MSHGHVVPVRTYVGVFLMLMLLTAVTVAAAFVDLGPLNNVVMLGIALFKASLVALIFMHVKYSTRMIPVVAVGSLFFLVILFAITMSDYLSRGWLGAGAP